VECGSVIWGRAGWLVIALVVQISCRGQPPQAKLERLTAATIEEPVGHDWAIFLGPTGNGHSAEKGVDPSLWKPHPPIVWETKLGVSYGAPAIVGSKLYQFDRINNRERLTCYDTEDGSSLWFWQSEPVFYRDMFGYNNGPRCSPIVDGDLIFCYGVTGQLYCIHAQSQKLVWQKDTMKEYGVIPNFFGVASNPVVFGDKLLVMIGGSPAESQGLRTEQLAQVKPNNSAVVAFDKRSGAELYRSGNDLASYASLSVQSVSEKPTGLAFLRGGLLVFEPNEGKEIAYKPWRAEMLESVNAAMPVSDGRTVFVSESYQIGSLLLDSSSSAWPVIWQDKGPRSNCKFRAHWATPVLIDGYLYGCSGRNPEDCDFRCIRWQDGQVQWVHRSRERSSVTVCDGYLIVLGEYGTFELIKPNPKRLEVIATADLGLIKAADGQPLLQRPCWAAPVIAHGKLYIRGDDRLVCMQLIKAD
jgi:outer membrane protein assembly factor BamB